MSQGLLEYHKARGTAYEVAMNEVKFLRYGEDRLTSIGTANLNGCSAVMVVSNHGAILAHISPLPDDHGGNPEAGDNHVQAKMDVVRALYKANREYFPAGCSNWVGCAVFQGELALPDQQRIIQENLTELGLSYSLRTYVAERRSRAHASPGQGTIFVDGTGDHPAAYVEDYAVSVSQESQRTAVDLSTADYSIGSSTYPDQSSSLLAADLYIGAAQSTNYDADHDTHHPVPSADSYYCFRDDQYLFFQNGPNTHQLNCPTNV